MLEKSSDTPIFVTIRFHTINGSKFVEGCSFFEIDKSTFGGVKLTAYRSFYNPKMWTIEEQTKDYFSIGFIDIEKQQISFKDRVFKLFKKPIIEDKKIYLSEYDLAIILGFDKVFSPKTLVDKTFKRTKFVYFK